MKLKKSISIALTLLMSIGILGGCSSDKQGESTSKSGSADRKAKNELVIALENEPEAGLDATTGGHGSLTRVFFSTLFKRDKNLGMINDLAKEYSLSEDRLTWTVKIRDDAKFTDGEPLTSEDVVYTYEMSKDSGSTIDLTMLESVKAIDDYTIEFKISKPQSTFIEKMSSIGIVPKHAHENNKDFLNNPIGSGPYKFVQWDKGQQIIVTANEYYYDKKPSIQKMTMVFLKDDAAYAAVKAGEVDISFIPGAFAKEKVDGKKIQVLDSIEAYGIEFPMEKSGQKTKDGNPIGNDVTSDKAIREAINYAINRQELVDGILEGYGTVSTTGLENMPWLNKDTILTKDSDVEKAKKILSDGGWADSDGDGIIEKDGVKAEFKLLYTPGKYRQELGLAVGEVAKELGIGITLELRTWDTITADINSSPVLFGWGSGDPSELYYLYSSDIIGKGVEWNNAGHYKNPKVDEYLNMALASENEEAALEYWKKAQWDGKTGFSTKGDCTYAWLVNAGHVYILDNSLDIGQPAVQSHGGRIFDNVCEWAWK